MNVDVIKNEKDECIVLIKNSDSNSDLPSAIIAVPKGNVNVDGKKCCRAKVLVNLLGKIIGTSSKEKNYNEISDYCYALISLLSGSNDLDCDEVCELLISCNTACSGCLN